MKYLNRDQFINFIKESRCNDDSSTIIKFYQDLDFCNALKLVCIEDISLILFKIQSEHKIANQTKKQFNLREALNKPKEHNNLNIMDYCLAAGLDELAFKLAALGARSDNMEILKTSLDKYYDGGELETPSLVMNIQFMIDKLQQDLAIDHIKNIISKNKLSFFKKHTETFKLMFQSHKFPLFLLVLGIACCAASAANPLLLTIGIPALLASVTSYQNAYNAVTNSIQLDDIAQFMHETGIIDESIAKCMALKNTATKKMEKLQKHSRSADGTKYDVSKEFHSSQLLHQFNGGKNVLISGAEPTIKPSLRQGNSIGS